MTSNNLTLSNEVIEYNNITFIKSCVDWYGVDQISFQLSNFLFFVAFLTPHNASNQICDLLFRLLITMGCSIYVIWIISIKEHCFFNYIIFFWPIFLFINFLHSFHLTYKLSPASLPKKFTKLYNTLFEPIKLSKKEFKVLTQHSLVVNLNKGEHYQVENQSLIDEKIAILLEGKLDVTQQNIPLHQIYPNDFVDSPEYKFVEIYLKQQRQQSPSRETYPFTTFNNKMNSSKDKACSDCSKQKVLIDNSIDKNKSMNKNGNDKKEESRKTKKLSSKHQNNCVFNRDMNNRSIKKEICLSIDSPIKDKLEFRRIDKLAQVTITASEQCKLLCWKRSLLVNDTLENNLRLKTIFNNLIGKDIITKLYLVNEEQRKQQQKEIGESQINSKSQIVSNLSSSNLFAVPQTPLAMGANAKLLAHNPLRGDNLFSKFREVNLLNSFPFLPHESMMYLNQYNRNMNIGILNQQNLINPYYSYLNNQAIVNPLLTAPNIPIDQSQFLTNIELSG